MNAHTVKDLIDTLSKLPPDAVVIGSEPPFDGVKVIPQNSGKVLVISDRKKQ